jgi:hypothetical protein
LNPSGILEGSANPFSQFPQAGRRFAGRHQLLGIFIAQLIEGKTAAGGNLQGLGEQRRRIELRQPHAQPQAALCIRMHRMPALGERLAQPYRRQYVLQTPARTQMHVDVAGGSEGQAGRFRAFFQCMQFLAVVGPAMQLGGDPCASLETLLDPAGIGESGEQHQRPAARQRFDIFLPEGIFPLGRAPPAGGDQRGDGAVGAPVGCEQDACLP